MRKYFTTIIAGCFVSILLAGASAQTIAPNGLGAGQVLAPKLLSVTEVLAPESADDDTSAVRDELNRVLSADTVSAKAFRAWLGEFAAQLLDSASSSTPQAGGGGGSPGGAPPEISATIESFTQALHYASVAAQAYEKVSDLDAIQQTNDQEDDEDRKQGKKRSAPGLSSPPPPPPLPGFLFIWKTDDDDHDDIPDYFEDSAYAMIDLATYRPTAIVVPLSVKSAGGPAYRLWFYCERPASAKHNGESACRWAVAANRSSAMSNARNCTARRIWVDVSSEPANRATGQGADGRQLEDRIAEAIRKVARVQYFQMKTSGEWGSGGKDSVLISYAMLLFGLPVDSEVTARDIARLELEMSRCTDLAGRTKDELRALGDDAERIKFGDKEYKLSDDLEINADLQACKSDCRLVTGMLGKYRMSVLARADQRTVAGHDVLVLEDEIVRTPVTILPIVALSDGQSAVIRRTSCGYIFRNKWIKACADSGAGDLSTGLARTALKRGYQVSNVPELQQKASVFVDEMVEFALRHELGHVAYCEGHSTPEDAGLLNAFAYFGEDNLVSVVSEPIADWSPGVDVYLGPIRYILQCAREGKREQARRMLMVYMSDNCFANEKTGLTTQTQIDLAIICSALKPGWQFDFAGLERRAGDIYKILAQYCLDTAKDVETVAKEAKYTINGADYDYEFIAEQASKFAQGDLGYAKEQALKLLNAEPDPDPQQIKLRRTATMWNVFLLMDKLSPNAANSARDLMKEREVQLKTQLLQLLDPKAASESGSDLEAYIKRQINANGVAAAN